MQEALFVLLSDQEMNYICLPSQANPAVHATIGDHASTVAAASVWNNLLETVHVLASLSVFNSRLKTRVRPLSVIGPYL